MTAAPHQHWAPPPPADAVLPSTAERAAVTDRLLAAYTEGRLDEAAYDQRSAAAARATTRGQLASLVTDLPPVGPGDGPFTAGPAQWPAPTASAPGPHPRRRPQRHRSLSLPWILTAIVVLWTLSTLSHLWSAAGSGVPWVLVAVVAAVVVGRHHYHH